MIDASTALTIAAIVAPTVTSLLAFFASRHNSRKIDGLEIQINGRLTQLLKLTQSASHAEGVIEGHAQSAVPEKKEP
jgi:hypothetical protein